MKKNLSSICVLVFVSIALCGTVSFAQYQNKLPTFSMRLTNGHTVSTINLPSDKPTVLIYFAPDCDHCQLLMKDFFKRIAAFKKTQIIMISFEPISALGVFEKNFQTHKYANIQVGSEMVPLYLQKFYQLQHTPFTALYDKNKNLIVSYKNFTPLQSLITRLKQLK